MGQQPTTQKARQGRAADGEMRRISAGKAVLVEDTHGKGHISRHPPEEQNVIQVLLNESVGISR